MTGPPIPAEVWGAYPPDHRPSAAPSWLGNAGGSSGSDLWRYEASVGPLLLRAWPTDSGGPGRVDQVHRWLRHLRDLPYVASPIPGRNGSTWQFAAGRAWELTVFLSGAADTATPPLEPHLTAMFATMARVHRRLAATGTTGTSPGLAARLGELERLIDGELATFRHLLDRSATDPLVPAARRWLGLAESEAVRVVAPLRRAAGRPLALQACLRDARPDHFLFDGDRLAGLVDFGAMGVDTAVADLARLLGETVGQDIRSRSIALDAYATTRAEEGLVEPTVEELDALARFEAANAVLGGARWVRWHFAEGRQFGDPDAVGRGLTRTTRRLEDWAGRAG